MIFVLHGRGGNGEESTTCKLVKEYFSDETVYCPSYDYEANHDVISKQLNDFVSEKIRGNNDEVIFIGCSMGGYWARYLANKHGADKLFMLNPSLQLYEESITKDDAGLPITVFLGLKDEVVNPDFAYNLYKDRAHVVVIENGDHRLVENMSEILPVIEEMINTFAI